MPTLVQSEYLIISNREKVKNLISSSPLTDTDIIDILICLHIVLEVGLNSFFRQLSLISIKKNIDRMQVIENIDSIKFIDKTVLFIYNSKFEFGEDIIAAAKHHKIIGLLKNFSEVRNKLLHGHAIATFTSEDNETPKHSKLKQKINLNFLQEQIIRFRTILDGVKFYLEHLDSSLTESGKQSFAEAYLDHSFIPNTDFSSV